KPATSIDSPTGTPIAAAATNTPPRTQRPKVMCGQLCSPDERSDIRGDLSTCRGQARPVAKPDAQRQPAEPLRSRRRRYRAANAAPACAHATETMYNQLRRAVRK